MTVLAWRASIVWLALSVAAARADDAIQLKAGPGDELVAMACGQCHTTDYIVMSSPFLTRDAWGREVAKMRGAFHAPIDETVAARIQDYLAANYAVAQKPSP